MSMTVETNPENNPPPHLERVATPVLPRGISKELLLSAFRNMHKSRRLDEKMLILLKQGKSYFHIGCMGHEAIQTAAAYAMEAGRDWAYPYYRGQSLCLGLGMTADDILKCFLSREGDPNSGGRQMPQHYGHVELNIPTQSSPTGTQYLQAVGCALGAMRDHEKAGNGTSKDGYDVTVVTSGDGTTSQGDFHEALNWASREKAPVVFLVEDNHYAISVPVRSQTANGKIANLGRGYDNLETVEVDGCDFVASYYAMQRAIQRARRGLGPTLLVADVVRLLPHSSSDDQRKYRPAEELEADRKRDPIGKLEQQMLHNQVATKEEIAQIASDIHEHVNLAATEAERAPMPDRETAKKWVLSELPEPPLVEPVLEEQETVLVDAINRALAEEMERNSDVLVYGEDVAGEKGGVFTATRGLTKRFGEQQCFNAPLAESSIIGVGIGLAIRGYCPVPEIQFGDYVWTAMMQIRNELATIRYRSNNSFSCPVIVRIPIGGYIHGALCHSQNIESFFAHIPGLKIALPSTALDAYGLLKNAIRGEDPVLFLEHKGLYRQNHAKSQLPTDTDWLLPFGKGRVRREGTDLTVITYGAMVQRSLQAASRLEGDGISVEVIDIRTINPIDWDLIMASVKKTNKALVVHEDTRFAGFGGEIAAEIGEKCFQDLDGPVQRIAAADTPIPYNWDLEEEILPQLEGLVSGMRALATY
jgi:2-oxoisovalerate dehydrogenase E1 component